MTPQTATAIETRVCVIAALPQRGTEKLKLLWIITRGRKESQCWEAAQSNKKKRKEKKKAFCPAAATKLQFCRPVVMHMDLRSIRRQCVLWQCGKWSANQLKRHFCPPNDAFWSLVLPCWHAVIHHVNSSKLCWRHFKITQHQTQTSKSPSNHLPVHLHHFP